MEKFNTDFEFFWSLIDNGNNFAYTRYADGEIRLMKGIDISLSSQAFIEDKWSTPIGMTKTGEHLLESETEAACFRSPISAKDFPSNELPRRVFTAPAPFSE